MVVQVDSDALVYCAALDRGVAPISTDEIMRPLIFGRAFNGSTSVILIALAPSTAYSLYCMAVSVASASHVDLARVVQDELPVSTLCCKELVVVLNAISVRENGYELAALTVVLSHAPSDSILVSVEDTGAHVAFIPANVAVWAASSSLVFSADMMGHNYGNGTVTTVLSGASKDEYVVVFGTPQTVQVLSSEEPPLVPRVIAVTFTNDAANIVVLFNAATDQGGLQGSFACSILLVFSQAASLKCQWVDAHRLIIYPSADVQVGDVVVVVAGAIRAECMVAAIPCGSWLTVVPDPMVGAIANPSSPIAPVIALSYATTLGACDNLFLDTTPSSGNGGRPWARHRFTVETTPAGVDVNRLVAFLNSSYSMSPPSPISADLFVPGTAYALTLTLCNFLDTCSSDTAFVRVTAAASAPIVSFLGSPARSMYTYETLGVAVSAYTANCNGSTSAAGLSYQWRVFQYGEYEIASTSQSVNPSRFTLARYSLQPNAWYTIHVQVTNKAAVENVADAFASVVVSVRPGHLVSMIAGGAEQTIRVNDMLELDGSGSLDEDVQDQSGSALDSVSFAWSCLQLLPVYSAVCPINLATKDTDRSVGIVDARGLSAGGVGAKMRVSLTLTATGRTATSFVDLVVVDAAAAAVLMVQALGSTDPATVLRLRGSISSIEPCAGQWNISRGVDLSEVALSPVHLSIPANATQHRIYLALRAGSLAGYATYRFVMTCGRGAASVDITTNGPPQYGVFAVEPKSGVELDTQFQMRTENWYDVNQPLSYQFEYRSTGGLRIVIQSRAERAFTASLLPAGTSVAEFNVSCAVLVFDSLGAAAQVTTSVAVTTAAVHTAGVLPTRIEAALGSAEGDVDAVRQVISLYASVLNVVNCSLSPNCASLSRLSCSSKSHTCDSCIDGFVGAEGAANTACLSAADFTAMQSSAPNTVFPNKTCPGDCSGSGICSFVDSSSLEPVASCAINVITCFARCICLANFSGDACAIPTADLAASAEVRSSLISNLFALTAQEDPNSESISSWVAGALLLSSKEEEMTRNSASSVLGIAAAATTGIAATSIELDSATAMDVLTAVDTASAVIGKGGAEVASGTNEVELNQIRGVLGDLGSLMMGVQVPGEVPIVSTLSSIKLSSQVSPVAHNVQLSLPQSSLEAAYGLSTTSVAIELPGYNAANVASTIVESKPFQFGSDGAEFDSNPLSVQLQIEGAVAEVVIVYKNLKPVVYDVYNDSSTTNNVTTECLQGVEASIPQHCPGDVEVVHVCNGTAGWLVTPCPTKVVVPECRTLSSDDPGSVCSVLNYTATTTACRCTPSPQSLRRQLNAVATMQSFQAVTVSVSIVDDFTTTLRTVPTSEKAVLQTLRGSIIVIAMFGTFWLGGLSVMAYFLSGSAERRVAPISSKCADSGVTASPITSTKDIVQALEDYVNLAIPSVSVYCSVLYCIGVRLLYWAVNCLISPPLWPRLHHACV